MADLVLKGYGGSGANIVIIGMGFPVTEEEQAVFIFYEPGMTRVMSLAAPSAMATATTMTFTPLTQIAATDLLAEDVAAVPSAFISASSVEFDAAVLANKPEMRAKTTVVPSRCGTMTPTKKLG